MAQDPSTACTTTASPAPGTCPLCGQANQCAMERARQTGLSQEPCWCTTATFTPALLDRVAPADRNRACICARCAAQASPSSDPV